MIQLILCQSLIKAVKQQRQLLPRRPHQPQLQRPRQGNCELNYGIKILDLQLLEITVLTQNKRMESFKKKGQVRKFREIPLSTVDNLPFLGI